MMKNLKKIISIIYIALVGLLAIFYAICWALPIYNNAPEMSGIRQLYETIFFVKNGVIKNEISWCHFLLLLCPYIKLIVSTIERFTCQNDVNKHRLTMRIVYWGVFSIVQLPFVIMPAYVFGDVSELSTFVAEALILIWLVCSGLYPTYLSVDFMLKDNGFAALFTAKRGIVLSIVSVALFIVYWWAVLKIPFITFGLIGALSAFGYPTDFFPDMVPLLYWMVTFILSSAVIVPIFFLLRKVYHKILN